MADSRIKARYFLDTAEVVWRGFASDSSGVAMAVFDVFGEDRDYIGTFSIRRDKLRRREDVTDLARQLLGQRGGAVTTEPVRLAAPGDGVESPEVVGGQP